jgi:O-antigen ligase
VAILNKIFERVLPRPTILLELRSALLQFYFRRTFDIKIWFCSVGLRIPAREVLKHFAYKMLRVTSFATFIVLSGLLLGAIIAIFPPMVGVGVVVMLSLLLLWAMPELQSLPKASLRVAFFAVILVEICIPAYYAVSIAGLPWISIRRIVVVMLIIFFAVTVAGSHSARAKIINAMANNKPLAICLIGYLAIGFLSIFTSAGAATSISQFSEILLNWYIPFFACLLVVRSEFDAVFVLKFIAYLSIVVSVLGIGEFITHHRLVTVFLPQEVIDNMASANPGFLSMLSSSPFRNGFYRASSIYTVALSYGEFSAMLAPIGVHFLLSGEKLIDRILGFVVLIFSIIGVFISGSRGGSVALLISMPVFAGLWILRYAKRNPQSLIGTIATLVATFAFGSLIAATFLWKRLHNIVLGGGDAASSSQARFEQWEMAKPHILANPVTGHGLGMAAQVIGWMPPGSDQLSVDSYSLTLLVETGITGFLLFFGIVFLAAWGCAKVFLSDNDKRAMLGAPLSSAFVAYGFYRLALSQRENQTLFYLLVAIAFIFISEARQRKIELARTLNPLKVC